MFLDNAMVLKIICRSSNEMRLHASDECANRAVELRYCVNASTQLTMNHNGICTSMRGHAVAQLVEAQAGRSRVPFPMVSLEFFIDITLGSTQPLSEMSTRNISWRAKLAFMCRLS